MAWIPAHRLGETRVGPRRHRLPRLTGPISERDIGAVAHLRFEHWMAAVEEGDEEALEALDGLLLVLMRGYNRMNRRTGPTWTSRSEPSNALTDRERRVVQCAADGLNYQQTAELLCVDRETVKSHLQSAMRKLEASNTTQCVAVAARLGLV